MEATTPLLAEQVVTILLEAGFPSLLIERGQVVMSGFIVVVEADAAADRHLRIQWTGTPDVNTLAYRRTILGAYASHLRQAGLRVAFVGDDGEPYLACQSGEPLA